MNRRTFFSALAVTPAVLVLPPIKKTVQASPTPTVVTVTLSDRQLASIVVGELEYGGATAARLKRILK